MSAQVDSDRAKEQRDYGRCERWDLMAAVLRGLAIDIDSLARAPMPKETK